MTAVGVFLFVSCLQGAVHSWGLFRFKGVMRANRNWPTLVTQSRMHWAVARDSAVVVRLRIGGLGRIQSGR